MAKRDPNHLTPEKDGRFCKRVRGVLHHFGRDGDRDAALREWLAVKDDLLAGRKVRARRSNGRPATVTVKFVRDHFIDACNDKVNARPAKMSAGAFDDYYLAVDEFGAAVGWGRDPDDLEPADFAAVRARWARRMGVWALDRYVQAVRTMFNHAATFRLIARQPFYGKSFSKTTEAEKREAELERARVRGERAFTEIEVRVLLEVVTEPPLRAMVLLGLNGGMYAKDVARLRAHHLRREAGEWIIDFDRGKTGAIPWKFVLWPETKAALDEAAALRRSRIKWNEPRDPADADRLFLTIHGRPYHREHVRRKGDMVESGSSVDLIGQEFDKLFREGAGKKAVDLLWIRDGEKWRPFKRADLGFGTLRHTHITAVNSHPDRFAARRVRGHKQTSVEKHYDKVPIDRLKSVTDLARSRLLGVTCESESPAARRRTA